RSLWVADFRHGLCCLFVHHACDLAAAAQAAGVHVETWIVSKADHTRALAVAPAEDEARLAAFRRPALP
ncbi:MAG TPA: hypothetical protein VK592_08845, partial [Candidatus Dormibacteraeota bacterium]|nr:hypothetical protein [Candidatus Dormibacteraeota bacterium]